ncbi:hypothetical protein D3C85_14600 [compost metagenome]
MSLEIIHGDLFAVPADTVVVTINLCGAMGAGVAKTARDTVPGLYKHYKKMYPVIKPSEFIQYTHNGIKYLLVPTKLDWKQPSPRELVLVNLHRLAYLTRRYNGFGKVALPPLGCGNGGLDWDNDISNMYHALFDHHPTEFVVVV